MLKVRIGLLLIGLGLAGLPPGQAADTRCPYAYTAVAPPIWAPSPTEWLRAQELAAQLTIDELAGASLIGNYAGSLTKPTAATKARNLASIGNSDAAVGIRQLGLGGVVLFTENATSAKAAAAQRSELAEQFPYFMVAIDQEGGSVVRLRNDVEPPIPAQTLGQLNELDLTEQAAVLSGNQLRAAGIDVVFAPVADLRTAQTEPSLANRTYGSNPTDVGAHVAATIRGYAVTGVMPTLKHFPGLGGITADTHYSAGKYNGSFRKLCDAHLAPFAAGIAAGAPIVMLGHAVYPMFGKTPASANPKIIKELLREDLSFTGIVITDSMAMTAATTELKPGQSLWIRALRAGADLLLMPSSSVRARAAITKALTNGKLSIEERRSAIARVFAWRMANDRVKETLKKYPAGATSLKQAAIAFRESIS